MHEDTFIDSHGRHYTIKRRFHKEARMRYFAESMDKLLGNNFDLLGKFVQHHQEKQVPRIQELFDYAEGENHTILKNEIRRKESDMADNRAVHNYGKLISNFKRGYLVGKPVQYEYMDNQEGSETDQAIEEVSTQNDFFDLNRSLVLDMSRAGRAFEILYFNQKEQLMVKRLDPRRTFAIYENTLDGKAICGVHYYNPNPFDKETMRIDVYGADKVHRLLKDKEGIAYIEDNEEKNIKAQQTHGFGYPQIIEHLNNTAGMGDYETELSLIDLMDAAQSDTANYMTDLADAILAIIGDVSFPDDIDTAEKKIEYMKQMRRARFMNLVPPKNEAGEESGNVDAKYLYKQYDVNGTEAYKSRLENNIHMMTSTPNMTDEHFSGTQSGEAMKYKLFGLDQERVSTQAIFEKGIRQRFRLIANIYPKISEENSTAFDDFDVSKLRITFTPNLPQSEKEIVEMVDKLYGVISNETLMALLKKVTDVNPIDEKERLERENPQQRLAPRLDVNDNAGQIDGRDEESDVLDTTE